MAISAADVKKLRDMTGAGMMDCKNALAEATGDLEAAIDILRTKGIAKAEKKASRTSTEGSIAIALSDDNKKAVLVALNCETDFVGRNEGFIAIAQNLADISLENNLSSKEDLLEFQHKNKSGQDLITEAVMKLGENIHISDFAVSGSEGFISTYIHLNGKIGVAVEMSGEFSDQSDEAGKNLAMQVAAMNPLATRRDGVPADLVEKEKTLYIEQLKESGKPENLLERIAEGKMNKYFSEVCLVEQDYVKESKQKVSEYLDAVSKTIGNKIDVNGFVRLDIG